MPQVLGYGEDALTYWALTQARGELLKKLDDPTPPDQALAIYRPSFGRRAAPSDGTKGRRAVFGEFDAILATRQATYLIESKWDTSKEFRNGVITLDDHQLHHHLVFKWYLQAWNDAAPTEWADFVKQHKTALESKFPHVAIAPVTSKRLTPNLEYILNLLRNNQCGNPENVLLFFEPDSVSPITLPPVTAEFRSVTLQYTPQNSGGYIVMG